MSQCCRTTRKGKPCPIFADRNRQGSWFCHVHDPHGAFRQQHPERTKQAAFAFTKPEAAKPTPEQPITNPNEECPFEPQLVDWPIRRVRAF